MAAAATDPLPTVKGECASGMGAHPLELFPIFRRIPRSIARDLVYTLIWNEMFAVIFTLLNVMFDPRETFTGAFWATSVFANCIGFVIHLEFMVGDGLMPGIHARGTAIRAAYYTVPALFGVFAGYWLATTILHFDSMRNSIFSLRGVLLIGTISLIISGVLLMIFIPRERAARLEAAFQQREGARARGREAGDARAVEAPGSAGRAAFSLQHARQRRLARRFRSGDGEADAGTPDRAAARRRVRRPARPNRPSARRSSTFAPISS